MLKLNPRDRITLEEALDHPFFRKYLNIHDDELDSLKGEDGISDVALEEPTKKKELHTEGPTVCTFEIRPEFM